MAEGLSNGQYHPPSPESTEPVATPAREAETAPVAPKDGYLCPSCEQLVAIEGKTFGFDAGPFVACPHCGSEFVLPPPENLELESPQSDPAADIQMDATRVHELARVRRASIRSRSWLMVGIVGCVAVGGELIQKTVEAYRVERLLTARSAMFIAFAVVTLVIAILLGRRAALISRELARPLLEEPTAPPDFSTLSDGSQHWKNLDKM